MRKSRYSGYEEPDMPADPTQALIDAPLPADKIPAVPLFPMGGTPFTPSSKCAHWCKLCDGAGSLVDFKTGKVYQCPDCLDPETEKGTGESWPDAPFYCPICHRHGLDGHPAVPRDVEPLPAGDAA